MLSSSIMNEGGAVAIGGGGSAGAGGANEIDPEMDPEMAMVKKSFSRPHARRIGNTIRALLGYAHVDRGRKAEASPRR